MASYSISIGTENIDRDSDIVLIDTLRASSTIVTALANGVEEVIPIDKKEDAIELKKKGYTLAGEHMGARIPGYDIGNSPPDLLDYIKKSKIKKLALKTTNTTETLNKIKNAIICSSLNLTAVRNALRGRNAVFLAVGSRHGTTEDLAVAFALYANLNDGLEINSEFLKKCIIGSNAAKHLTKLGYKKDIEFICQIDKYTVVPTLKNGIIQV